MHQLFSLKISLVLYSVFAVIGVFGHAFITGTPFPFWQSILPGVGVGAFLLAIFGNHWVFGWIWQCRFVQKITFSFIGGEWVGELKSNWGVVNAMYEHAKTSKKLDADDISFAKQPFKPVQVKVTIRAGLFKTDMKLVVSNVEDSRESRSVCMQLIKNADGKESVYYVYKQTTHLPVNTDESEHIGAAALEVKRDDNDNIYLEGIYWTARSWQRGLNTAGAIKLTRP